MPLSLTDLPDDVAELKQLLLGKAGVIDAQAATLDATKAELAAAQSDLKAAKSGLIAATLETEKLKLELARLKRLAFGKSSERLAREISQLELQLEEIETAQAEATEPVADAVAADATPADTTTTAPVPKKPRRQLPGHLPRVTETHEPASTSCTTCGTAAMRKVGEDVSEVLEYIPGHFQVIRHVRPAYSCRKCEAMAQAPMPSLPIPRGQAGPGLIAHVLMAKYADHLPLYRQSEIYARDGVDLDRGTLADWVGTFAWCCRFTSSRRARTIGARPPGC